MGRHRCACCLWGRSKLKPTSSSGDATRLSRGKVWKGTALSGSSFRFLVDLTDLSQITQSVATFRDLSSSVLPVVSVVHTRFFKNCFFGFGDAKLDVTSTGRRFFFLSLSRSLPDSKSQNLTPDTDGQLQISLVNCVSFLTLLHSMRVSPFFLQLNNLDRRKPFSRCN